MPRHALPCAGAADGVARDGRFLAENSAQFLGFEIDAGVRRRFLERFPQEQAMLDLARWHAFETEHPQAFTGMYQF